MSFVAVQYRHHDIACQESGIYKSLIYSVSYAYCTGPIDVLVTFSRQRKSAFFGRLKERPFKIKNMLALVVAQLEARACVADGL